MSIQHRSRIKSVADYSSLTTSSGACCYARAEVPILEYYNTCVANGGHWQPIEGDDPTQVKCPDIGATGCCCACSYVDDFRGATGLFKNHQDSDCSNVAGSNLTYPCYQGGLENNVTFCECSDRGGIWAKETDCSVYTHETPANGPDPPQIKVGAHMLCTQGEQIEDVRWPGACCSGVTCDDACTIKECAEFGLAHGSTGINFWEHSYCDELPYGESDYDLIVNCSDSESYHFEGDDRNFEHDNRTGILVAKKSFGQTIKDINISTTNSQLKSSCSYINSTSKELTCTNETKTSCDKKFGIWSGFNDEHFQISCSDATSIDIQNYITNKKKLDNDTISSWKIGQRVLNQGRYIGTFQVQNSSTGIGSECFGSETTGTSYSYRAKNINDFDDASSSSKTYAIIISDSDYTNQLLPYDTDSKSNNVKRSSKWDTSFNSSYNNTSLYRKINNTYNKNKWWVWGLASKDMTAFIHSQTNKIDFILNTTTEDLTPHQPYKNLIKNDSVFYWTSTFLTDIKYNGKEQLSYIQSFGDNSVVALSPISMSWAVRVILTLEVG